MRLEGNDPYLGGPSVKKRNKRGRIGRAAMALIFRKREEEWGHRNTAAAFARNRAEEKTRGVF